MDRNSLKDYQAPPNAYFRKKSKDCFAEYSTNRRFRRIIESGNFVFVDEHLVINDAKYVAEDRHGKPCLSDYARKNLNECCLLFDEQRHVTSYKRRRTKSVKASALKVVWTFGKVLLFIVATPFVLLWFLLKAISFPFRWVYRKVVKAVLSHKNHDYYDDHHGDHYDDVEEDYEYYEHKSKPDYSSHKHKDEARHIERSIRDYALYERRLNADFEYSDDLFLDVDKVKKIVASPSSRPTHADILNKTPMLNTAEHNMEVFNRSAELKKLHANMMSDVEFAMETMITFSDLAWANMKRCNCVYKESFRERTLLSDKTFDRIKSGRLDRPDVETVIALCLGLNLGVIHSDPLLKSAGIDLTNSSVLLHRAYRLLICTFHEHSIYECNEALLAWGLPAIRAKAYKDMLSKQ